MASTEPAVSPAPEPAPGSGGSDFEPAAAVPDAPARGRRRDRATPRTVRPVRISDLEDNGFDDLYDDGFAPAPMTETALDDDEADALLSELTLDDRDRRVVETEERRARARSDQPAERPRGRMKARKVRRVVRYVSPWSVLKVSVLFYACLWVIMTVASIILWRVAVASGTIENFEKFVARLFGETSFTIDGREIFRASTIAGMILVFAGTGFTVLMSLLFNVICDITGGVRFTVLELEATRRELRRPRRQAATQDRPEPRVKR